MDPTDPSTAKRSPSTGWIGAADGLTGAAIHEKLATLDQAQESEILQHGGPEAFLRARAPAVLTLFSGPWEPRLVQAETTAAWVSAGERLVECARCPAHGGTCKDAVSVAPIGHQVGYAPDTGLVYRACGKWGIFEERERARASGVPAALLDWPLERLLLGDPGPVRTELLAWLELARSTEKAPSFLVTGRSAVDRTRLAAGIAMDLVRRGARVHYTFAPRLAADMRDYWSRAKNDDAAQSVESPIDRAESASILVFDFVDPRPVSREPWADWFLSRVDLMLYRRLSADRPTVLASRLSVSELFKHFEYAGAFPVLECDMGVEAFGEIRTQ